MSDYIMSDQSDQSDQLPKKIVNSDGREEYILESIVGPNKWHRLDGPAMIWPSFYEIWFAYGEKHRLNVPAGTWFGNDGQWRCKEWWHNDLLNRLDGPAIEYRIQNAPRINKYYVNGVHLSEEEFNKQYPQYEILEVF